MRFAYADPPYLGMCNRYNHHHPDGQCWDDIQTHSALISTLEGYDGWALSLATPNLRDILPLTPKGTRIGAWVKPFASFKRGVNPAYAWEPVLFMPLPRKHDLTRPTTRDWTSVNITLKKGLVGAKPPAFSKWLLDLCRVEPDDELFDLFTGTGGVLAAWEAWRQERVA